MYYQTFSLPAVGDIINNLRDLMNSLIMIRSHNAIPILKPASGTVPVYPN
jgi:hypothetical protein